MYIETESYIFHTRVNLLNLQQNQIWKISLKIKCIFFSKIRSSVLACVLTQNTYVSKLS